jgi:ABC-type antimicrobial peptide transport system permease subunit
MILNYLKITFRSLKRNWIYTLINVLGLGIGFAGIIFTYALFQYEYTFDNLQKNTQKIYRVNATRIIQSNIQKWGITPLPLGPEAADQMAGIEGYCRYGISGLLIKYQDNIHSEQLFFADTNFFDLFNFPLKEGSHSSFKSKNTAFISQDFARKYFGDEPALGKQLDVIMNDSVLFNIQVGGILEKIPQNSSFHFDVIIPYDHAFDIYQLDYNSWSISIPSITYLVVNENTDPETIENDLDRLVAKNNEILDDWQVTDFYLMPFRNQKDESRILYSGITWPGLPLSALYGSLFMNVVILAISCFNFTNTAMAYARKRLKEIGVRKTFGGVKKQIITQFMLENSIQSFFAVLFGMDLASKWANWSSSIWPIEIRTDYLNNPEILVFVFIIFIAITFIAGSYPSFYISRYQPSHILKGDLKFSGTTLFTRALLTLQFAFCVTAVFTSIVLTANAKFQNDLDWGYDKENVLVVPMHEEGDFEIYRNEVEKIEEIDQIAGSIDNVSFRHSSKTIDIDGEKQSIQLLRVADNYVNTLGLQIIEGRGFLKNSENDIHESIIVNEKFVETFQIVNPLSQTIKMDDKIYFIVGVIKDFMPYGLHSPVRPVIFSLIPESQAMLLCVRSEPDKLLYVYQELNNKWKALFPNKPFDGYYQEESAMEAKTTNMGILQNFGLLGIFALILSTTGLYAMVSLNINKRTKEIGIRKVMGATVMQIVHLLNREFLIILTIAAITGSILGYYFMNYFLSDVFDYYTPLGPGVYIITISIIFLTAFITSGRKIIKSAHINPASSLHYE